MSNDQLLFPALHPILNNHTYCLNLVIMYPVSKFSFSLNLFLSLFLVMMYGGLTRDTGHAHRPAHLSNRIITPEELEGLEAVLRFTERVADKVGC